jgi:hypothetical protein
LPVRRDEAGGVNARAGMMNAGAPRRRRRLLAKRTARVSFACLIFALWHDCRPPLFGSSSIFAAAPSLRIRAMRRRNVEIVRHLLQLA